MFLLQQHELAIDIASQKQNRSILQLLQPKVCEQRLSVGCYVNFANTISFL